MLKKKPRVKAGIKVKDKAIMLNFRTGKPHLSNKEIRDRKDNNFRLGDDHFEMPVELNGDPEAMSEWYRIVAIYTEAGLDITSSADANIIARYCMLCSEYRYCILTGVSYKAGMMEQMLRIEDRLFLNPLAKMRNIPMIVKRDEKKEDLNILGFGSV